MPAVRAFLGHRPGIAVLGRVGFAIERNSLGVVAKGERVLVVPGVSHFISEAVECALVRIEFPPPDEGIVRCER